MNVNTKECWEKINCYLKEAPYKFSLFKITKLNNLSKKCQIQKMLMKKRVNIKENMKAHIYLSDIRRYKLAQGRIIKHRSSN